jgi:pimeloyl-ACP methyl ester carboxylesterase
MPQVFPVLVCLSIVACTSNGERIDALARSAQLQRYVIESNQLPSVVYLRASNQSDPQLIIFFEGDGIPWRAGITPNPDPTTRDPLALELLMRTPGNAAYLSRPCYQGLATERCTPDLWTSARYSAEIVQAMTLAVKDAMSRTQAEDLILVGYSGGGVLASLIAEQLGRVSAVITIAANLDIDEWAKYHRYLALSGSLNPALSRHPHPWIEIHMEGSDDDVVPSATRDAYFERYPSARRWIVEKHGHKCCWVDEWKELWERVQAELLLTSRPN